MQLTYEVAENTGKHNTFRNGLQGGLVSRPFVLEIQSSPSACHNNCHTVGPCVQTKILLVISFSKLGAIYGKLDLFTRPKQVFNVDEIGVSIVHKPGKVLAELV